VTVLKTVCGSSTVCFAAGEIEGDEVGGAEGLVALVLEAAPIVPKGLLLNAT